MALYQLKSEQKLPISLAQAWEFLSSPNNLKRITPPAMNFTVTSQGAEDPMYAGMIITYKVCPFLGIPMTWVTEITQVEKERFFVDEQRVGPYRLWHHEHHIEAIPGGVLMRDQVSYQPPLGILGDLAHSLWIRKQLQAIFQYREKALIEIFGEFGP